MVDCLAIINNALINKNKLHHNNLIIRNNTLLINNVLPNNNAPLTNSRLVINSGFPNNHRLLRDKTFISTRFLKINKLPYNNTLHNDIILPTKNTPLNSNRTLNNKRLFN